MARDTWEGLQGRLGRRKKIHIIFFQKLNIFKHNCSSVFKGQYNQNVLIGERVREDPDNYEEN